MELLLCFLLLFNAVAFCLMLADKQRARKKKWRIPERILLGSAVLGGSLGILLGMYAARHKTRHLRFAIGVPVIFAVQAVGGIMLFLHFG